MTVRAQSRRRPSFCEGQAVSRNRMRRFTTTVHPTRSQPNTRPGHHNAHSTRQLSKQPNTAIQPFDTPTDPRKAVNPPKYQPQYEQPSCSGTCTVVRTTCGTKQPAVGNQRSCCSRDRLQSVDRRAWTSLEGRCIYHTASKSNKQCQTQTAKKTI